MRRNKARYLDYFVDGEVIIPALFLEFEEMGTLLDAAYDGKIIFVNKTRKRGA